MYAVGHTSHNRMVVTDSHEARIRARKEVCGIKFKSVFYRKVVKNEVWSYFETRDQAIGFQTLLHLGGGF